MGTHKSRLTLVATTLFAGMLIQGGMGPTVQPIPQAFSVPAGGEHSTFKVAGDSITAAGSNTVAAGHVGEASWVNFVNDPETPTELIWTGGWALGGAQSGDMASALRNGSADSLVILAGTNDLAHGNGQERIAKNLARIANIVKAPVVLLSSVPPRDDAAEATVAYNEFLVQLAGERGWRFVDAAAGLRSDANTFLPGLSDDGIHPNAAGAQILGNAIGQALTATPMSELADNTGLEPLS